jgi:CRISPR-associated endonuclease/helicase Cas3
MTAKKATADDTPVNHLRGEILAHVRRGAASDRGLFTLTVPTCGGKTLSSLAFALEHAKRHGLDRIVYAIPFTSIIDQTALIFREVLGEDVVLEHHSSIDEEKLGKREARDKLRLAMEDWAAPIVVTTNVQLFESLHSNRPSRCRRLHNLARAVIVLDEAQTIPLPLLRPCLVTLDELTRNYGTSFVLCTATQPAIAVPDFEGGLTLGKNRELAPDPARLHKQLCRVRLAHLGERTDEELLSELAGTEQGLVIVNSRAHALGLYKAVAAAGLEGVVHLTTTPICGTPARNPCERSNAIEGRRALSPDRDLACGSRRRSRFSACLASRGRTRPDCSSGGTLGRASGRSRTASSACFVRQDTSPRAKSPCLLATWGG